MKSLILTALGLLVSTAVQTLPAQTYNIPWHKVAGGGGTGAGGIYAVSGTAGQWDAGNMSGGNLSLNGGFWVFTGAGGASSPPQNHLVNLGTLDDSFQNGSEAFGINNSGAIVGYSYLQSQPRAAYWASASSAAVNLGTAAGFDGSYGWKINDSGAVVGWSTLRTNGTSHATLWPGGLDLGTFRGGLNSAAFGLNASGQIVGYAEADWDGGIYNGAAYWDDGNSGPLDLGHHNSRAYAINDSEIVGASSTGGAAVLDYYGNELELISPPDHYSSVATGINGSGQIIGYYESNVDFQYRALFWPDAFSPPVVLASLPGSVTIPWGINASGQIVGQSGGNTISLPASPSGSRAVLWLNSTSPPIDLNSVVPAGSGLELNVANGINDFGEIVGTSTMGYLPRAFALTLNPLAPLSNSVPANVTAVAAGSDHSLSLRADGSLWAMGGNGDGDLGDSTSIQHSRPEPIVASGVTAVAAGLLHSLFLKSDGSLWAMGDNEFGQLGDGTTDNRASPVRIVPSGVTAIAAGFLHSLFLKSDGSLWAMGWNYSGQLGDGTTMEAHTPEQIVGSGVVAIAGGYTHSLFLKSDGSLWAMGSNGSGELGDGTTADSPMPKQVMAGGVAGIAAGYSYSFFIKSDGSLWAVGYNNDGQLGDGTISDAPLPERIVSSGVMAITTSGSSDFHSLFLKTDGSLWAMGDNGYGELGDGTTDASHIPEQIVCGGVTAIACGWAHSLFVKSDGSLWAMGYNDAGELGDGTQVDRHTPERIVGTGPIPTLVITSVARVGNDLQLSFASDLCHNYNVLTTSDLTAAWSALRSGIPGNGSIVQVTVSNAFVQPRQFFRILQAP